MAVSPARKAAFDILRQVEQGGYASDLLRLETASLSTRDAGLAAEIVFGALRFQSQLDYLTAHFSGRDAAKLDLDVRLVFRIGIYQLRYLDRIPAHAAVGESVELIKRARNRSASGLVNAVLRKVNRELIDWPDLQTELCHPKWLLDSWERRFGAETARGIAAANLRMPDAYLRIPAARLSEAGDLAIEETSVPGCYRLRDGAAGPFRQQDISSQTIVPLLKLEPGQSYLDLCAAPGNKTAQALETPLRAVACDVNFARLVGLRDLPAALVNLDASAPLPFQRPFDRILVDAPCSGTGTIGRNPEIKWRIQPAAPGAHHARQIRLLRRALDALAPGGLVVYATCSLQDEENEDVVRETLDQAPFGVRLEAQVRRTPGVEPGDGFYAASIARTEA